MTVNYFAETEGHSGVRNYSRKLMAELEKEVEINHITPSRILKPSFLNKPLLNPLKFYTLPEADITHVTNQDDLAFFLPMPDTKLVVTVHDIYPFLEAYSGLVYSMAAKLYVRNIERYADKVIAVSEATKEQLLEHTSVEEERIEVIYEGVDTDTFRPVDTNVEYDKYFLHVGSELDRKNIPGLIRIFSRIKEEEPDAQLVRVGSITDMTRKEIEKEGLELGEDVIYETDVTEERLVALYSNAEKLLFPSHAEGFGRPILESLACGTPVVAYNKKPMSELLPDEMLVKEGDEAEFADTSLGLEIREDACRTMAKEFSWDKTARETIQVYQDMKEDE